LDRFFSNHFKTLIECPEVLFCDELPRFPSFLHIWIGANKLADFYFELGDPGSAFKYARDSVDAFLTAEQLKFPRLAAQRHMPTAL